MQKTYTKQIAEWELVYDMRAEIRKQKIALFNLSWKTCMLNDSNFSPFCAHPQMTTNDYKGTASIDLWAGWDL